MTECNGCGSCCDPVVLPFTQDEARRSTSLDPVTKNWVVNILVPMRAKEARSKEPFIFDRPHIGSRPDETLLFTYRCGDFDPVERVCTNYEGRPAGCRRYPWKKDHPDPSAKLPPTCSFRVDIGQVCRASSRRLCSLSTR